MQIAGYATKHFYSTPTTQPHAHGAAAAKVGSPGNGGAATVVTISQAALEASAETDFAAVINAARQALNVLLSDAGRVSPLLEGKLALDLSSLSQRELHAIKSTDDGLFTSDERKAAELEIGRRFDAALTGPAAVSEVTGDYRVLYRAAAAHLDSLSAEQKEQPGWSEARAAIDTALTALQTDHATPPKDIANDPVASFLKARAAGEITDDTSATLAENLRAILDKRYEEGFTLGRNASGKALDLGSFDSRAISTMALNRDGLFSAQEVNAANAEIRLRANTALSEGYKDAARSGDPTAFSRNIIALYSSMSADERQAAGFSDKLLSTAVSSYESTMRLMDVMEQGMANMGGMASWFGR